MGKERRTICKTAKSMRFRRFLLAFVLAVTAVVSASILSASRACAHDPRFACSPRSASKPVTIPDPTKSWAFYGRLAAGQQDHYVFTTVEPLRVPISLLVDLRDASDPTRPGATLYDDSGTALATVDLSRATRFYEPFSRVNYLTSSDRSILLMPGRYTIIVTVHDGRSPQRYALAVGEREGFSVLEIPFLAGAIYRIHNRRF